MGKSTPIFRRRLMADSVEKVGSRTLQEFRLNDGAIFDLICLLAQIDCGRFGLTRSRAMRSPRVFLERQRLRRRENCAVLAWPTFFF